MRALPATSERNSGRYYRIAVVLDCFSRRVVGWAMADHPKQNLHPKRLGRRSCTGRRPLSQDQLPAAKSALGRTGMRGILP